MMAKDARDDIWFRCERIHAGWKTTFMQTVLRRPRSPLEMGLKGRRSGVRLALDFGIQFGPEKHDDH